MTNLRAEGLTREDLTSEELTRIERIVFYAIIHPNPFCEPCRRMAQGSVQYLAVELNLPSNWIWAALDSLVERGLIERELDMGGLYWAIAEGRIDR